MGSVGGCTSDGKRKGVFGGGGSFRSGVQPPTGSRAAQDVAVAVELEGFGVGWFLSVGGCTLDWKRKGVFVGGGSFRSGVQPPTGSRAAQDVAVAVELEGFGVGWFLSVGGCTLDWKRKGVFVGGGSFRSGVQPPTGSRAAQDVAVAVELEGFGVGWFLSVGGCTLDWKRKRVFGVGGSFRSGVQPPTGSRAAQDVAVAVELEGFGVGWFLLVGGCTLDWKRKGYLSGVDRSGRGFNPRPAQGRLKMLRWRLS